MMRKLFAAFSALIVAGAIAGCSNNIYPGGAACKTVVSSAAQVQPAIDAAAANDQICLADGTYQKLTLTSSKPVVIEAQNPGNVTVQGASLGGRGGITLARVRMLGTGQVQVGSRGVTFFQNFFDMNNYTGYGVEDCPSSTTTCDDVSIIGNKFVGEAEEDAIRANRYHDSDGNGLGLAVLYNEFSGNIEKGDHNDVFQSVWVGDHLNFSNNYLHDFGGQGFFVKDQATAIDGFVANNNLIINQNLPCRPTTLCPGFQLSPFQIFGPIKNGQMKNNTVGWGAGGGVAVLTGSYSNIDFSNNVFRVLAVTNSGGSGTVTTGSNNTYCQSNSWPVPVGTTVDCNPAFANPAALDYRIPNTNRGVNWTPATEHYGP